MAQHPARARAGLDERSAVREKLRHFIEHADTEFGWLLREEGVSALETLWLPCFHALVGATRADARAAPRAGALRSAVHQARHRAWLRAAESAAASASVVFWPATRMHLPAALPIAAELEHRNERIVFFTDKPRLARELGAAGRAVRVPRGLARARARARRRAAAARRLVRGMPACRALGEASDRALRTTLHDLLPFAFESIATARHLLGELSPRALIVGNDISVEGRAACLVSAKKRVRTICAAHGASSANPLYGDHLADRILVYSEADQRELTAFGLPPGRAAVCGAPGFDAYPAQGGKPHPDVQEALDLAPGGGFILIATSGPGDKVSRAHHGALIAVFAELAERFVELPIAVKLHPKDALENYAGASARLRVFGARTRLGQLPITDWLQGCRLLVTGASTVALEAMLLQVPVVTVDLMNELGAVDFIASGATCHVESKHALFEAVTKLAGAQLETRAALEARAARFLGDKFGTRDGRAAARAADAILGGR